MSTYQIHFKADPTHWPTDSQQLLAAWEQTFQAVEALVEAGSMEAPHFITNAEGYVRLEADSMAAALAIAAPFFPFWTQDIEELVPFEQVKESILGAFK